MRRDRKCTGRQSESRPSESRLSESRPSQRRSRRGIAFSARLALVALTGLGGLAAGSATVTPAEQSQSLSVFEVRLRKMHLVRPDLIPYPTRQEFYA